MNTIATAATDWFGWAPDWAISLGEFVIALVVALLVHALLFRLAQPLTARQEPFWQSLFARIRPLTRFALLAIVLALVSGIAPLTFEQSAQVQRVLVIVVIALIAWIVATALNLWIAVHLRRFQAEGVDPFLSRRHVTQTQILQRIATFVIWFTAVAAALMTFDSVRQYGVSLLASAGAAGIIVGLALQPVLKNLIAGLQIAVTQPIRIGDALIVEGEYGTVEDIKATFVQVRLWDLRRMVIPLAYFIEQPFQNWTRESANLLGSVLLYVDYALPVPPLRDKARELVEASPLWDKKTFAVQVTDFKERTMEVRVLLSAADSGKLFDLRASIREQLVAFLQASYPEALPRVRSVVEERLTDGGSGEAHPAPPGDPRPA